MGCGRENVILGLPWLCTMNPTIDWVRQTLTISKSCNQSKDLYSAHATDAQQHDSFLRKPLPHIHHHINVDIIYDLHLYDYLDHDMEEQYLQHLLNNHQINRIL